MASTIKITKLSAPKTAAMKTAPSAKYTAPVVRAKTAVGRVTSIKPGTLRNFPSSLPTTIRHPGQPVTPSLGTLRAVKQPR